MEIENPSPYNADSTLGDLPSVDSSVPYETSGELVLEVFNNNPHAPGVILLNGQEFFGVISRESFFEKTGRRFGVEVFLNRPINLMMEKTTSTPPLILPAYYKISQAANLALNRHTQSVYEPIVVKRSENDYQLIDILTIFMAENKILLALRKLHTYTITAGINISDDEAIKRFVHFSGIPLTSFSRRLVKLNTIQCDQCGQKLQFSVTDIVRSHPNLERGIEISSKMGTQTYTLFVRHMCENNIREIPAQFDQEFNLRAIRLSRVVETNVE